jgi:predicted dienelactone hydrolase
MSTAAWTLLPLLAACTGRTDPAELLEPGPHAAGYLEDEVVYDPGDGERSLRLAVWYPSTVAEGPDFRYDGIYPVVDVYRDTPVAEGAFPLVVFSHGHQGYAEASSRIIAQMVQHGVVVVSPDHTDNLVFDGDNRTTDIYWKRPLDLTAVLDHALDPGFALADSLEADDGVLAMGHSFGGYSIAAWAGAAYADERFTACEEGEVSAFCSTMTADDEARLRGDLADPRVDGLVTMAPGDHRLFTDAGLAAIDVPVLLMTGGLDDVEQNTLQWSGFDAPGNHRLDFPTATHLTFTDFAPNREENLAPETAFSVMGAYALAFQRHVAGDRGASRAFDDSLDPLDPVVERTVGQ